PDMLSVLIEIISDEHKVRINTVSDDRDVVICLSVLKSHNVVENDRCRDHNEKCLLHRQIHIAAHDLEKRQHEIDRYHGVEVPEMRLGGHIQDLPEIIPCPHIIHIPK